MKKFFILVIFAGIFFFNFSQNAFAVSTPIFPICSSPSGQSSVYYPNGTHGVPGRFSQYSGSDQVFTLSDTTTMQCLCLDDGTGIQTNWWKISSLTDQDIQILKNLGWVYIPSGSVWGLSDSPYLAFNTSYSCRNGGTGGTASGGNILGQSTPKTGSVLGLAATGNLSEIFLLLSLGFLSLFFFFVFCKKLQSK